LRSKWTEAWDEPGAPPIMGFPMQLALTYQTMRRVTHARAKEVLTYPVGQIIGQVDRSQSVRQIFYEMLAEFADTAERFSGNSEGALQREAVRELCQYCHYGANGKIINGGDGTFDRHRLRGAKNAGDQCPDFFHYPFSRHGSAPTTQRRIATPAGNCAVVQFNLDFDVHLIEAAGDGRIIDQYRPVQQFNCIASKPPRIVETGRLHFAVQQRDHCGVLP
jgi:hypothetical protein